LQWSDIGVSRRDDVKFDVLTGFPFSTVSTTDLKISQNWFGTTRLRLGYQFADRFLGFVTGGIA
jgi:hypothetical protein